MKRHLTLSAVAAVIVGSATLLVAADKPKAGPTTKPAATQPAAKPVNKMCLVEDEHEIDPKVTVNYKGKTIGFCCKDCVEEFEKDPEKYVKRLK